jgi:hypothetical protein
LQVEANAARISFTAYLFCLEFGQARKKEHSPAGDRALDKFDFSPELTVLFSPDFAPGVRWVLADGVIALEALGKVNLPPHYDIERDRNPFVYPPTVSKTGKPESYAQFIMEGLALPDGVLSWKIRHQKDESLEARPGVGLTVIDAIGCRMEADRVSLELAFTGGGEGYPQEMRKVSLSPTLAWQSATLVSDMIFAFEVQHGKLRIALPYPPVVKADSPRLVHTFFSSGAITRQIGPPLAS